MTYLLVMNFLTTVTQLLKTLLKFITIPIRSHLTEPSTLKKYGQLFLITSFMHDRKRYCSITT